MYTLLALIETTLAILVAPSLLIGGMVIAFGNRETNVMRNSNFFPRVSLVIPSRNESAIIRKKLENVLALNYPVDRLEVLFIDASSDSTPDIVRKFGNEHPFIRLIEQTEPGFNGALNQGYSAATGDIIVKSDCDAFPKPDALLRLVSDFADARIGVVSAVHRIPDSSRTESSFRRVQSKILVAQSFLHSTFIAHGAFSGYRASIIPKLPSEVTADDSEVVLAAVRKGFRAIIDPDVQVEESYPEEFALRREMKDRRAAGVVRVILHNMDIFFNPKYGKFGLFSFPMTFFIVIAAPLLFTCLMVLVLLFALTFNLFLLILPVALAGSYAISLVSGNKIATVIRTLADSYLSSMVGIVTSFRRSVTWNRSAGQRIGESK